MSFLFEVTKHSFFFFRIFIFNQGGEIEKNHVNFCRTGFVKSVLCFSLKKAGVESCTHFCRIRASENVL